MRLISVRASGEERSRRLAGDDAVGEAIYDATHAIDISAPPEAVWPWIVQIGADRAGWYSYDWLDNGRRPSADRILPEHQQLAPGDVVPALPGASDAFVVLDVVPGRHLVLGVPMPDGSHRATMSLSLEARDGPTRLVVRARLGVLLVDLPGAGRVTVPRLLAVLIARPVHYVMQRKELTGIKRRVEAAGAAGAG